MKGVLRPNKHQDVRKQVLFCKSLTEELLTMEEPDTRNVTSIIKSPVRDSILRLEIPQNKGRILSEKLSGRKT